MSSTGINSFYTYLGLNPSNFAISYPFTGQINDLVPSVANANPLYSGKVIGVTGGFATGASGMFDASRFVQIQNVGATFAGNNTFMFTYSKPTTGGGVMFSSLTGSAATYYSGYNIGINDANRLYFEYNNGAPVVLTSNTIYGQKNAVAVNVGLNNISFNYYDFSNKNLISENFYINSSYLLPSYSWALGKNICPYLPASPFSGSMDNFSVFSTSLANNSLSKLFSGVYSIATGFPAVSGNLVNGVITGYSTFFTGTTGVTSYSVSFSGYQSGVSASGNCSTYPVFNVVQNTGYFSSGYQTQVLTGQITGYYRISDPYTGYIVDTGYENGFGMDFVSYLWDRGTGDFREIVNITGTDKVTYIGYQSSYDQIQNEFAVNSIYPSGNLNVWLNGVLQLESGYVTAGQFYNTTTTKLADYYTSGTQYLYSNNFVSGKDVEYYDIAQQQNRQVFSFSAFQNYNDLLTGKFGNNVYIAIPADQYSYANSTLTSTTGVPSGYYMQQLTGTTGSLTLDYNPFYVQNISAIYNWNGSSFSLFGGSTLTGAFIVNSDPNSFYTGQLSGTNSYLYLNGLRMASGIDYSVGASGLLSFSPQVSGIDGTIYTANPYTGEQRSTGSFDRYSGAKFYRETTMYYLNGARLDPSLVLEHSKVDLISGANIFDSSIVSINDGDDASVQFWG